MNSMIFCKGCSCEMGKRKDVPNKRRCDDCKIKIKKENNIKNRKYINEYYKDRYNNDEEYRKKGYGASGEVSQGVNVFSNVTSLVEMDQFEAAAKRHKLREGGWGEDTGKDCETIQSG